ncbi:dipeptidase [Cesiribacter andamanensis]|nr:dipeptidase [Cesiribacter andamanensis]
MNTQPLPPFSFLLLLLLAWAFGACQPEQRSANGGAAPLDPTVMENAHPEPELTEAEQDSLLLTRAQALAQTFIIVDGHIDLPYRLQSKQEDVSKRTPGGDFDAERAQLGGLNAPFMSIYIPASLEEKGGGKALAERLIGMVEKLAADHPDKFALALSPSDVRENFEQGLISLPMGMENGTPLEGKLDNVAYFYQKGIRYITLAHSKSNHICDSSYDPKKKWGGLSPFGREVVQKMNEVGIMIDVSHISDSAFYQVMRLSKAPVIASHSSCRHFTPGFERNMSDDMIRALAQRGGVIMINFGSAFISDQSRKLWDEAKAAAEKWGLAQGHKAGSTAVEKYREQYFHKRNGRSTVQEVAAHIDHVVKLVGAEYVGFGSDFDGVGDSLPEGLRDVADYPNLIYELLKMGYSEGDIRRICSENVLRVWNEVEQFAGKAAEISQD